MTFKEADYFYKAQNVTWCGHKARNVSDLKIQQIKAVFQNTNCIWYSLLNMLWSANYSNKKSHYKLEEISKHKAEKK